MTSKLGSDSSVGKDETVHERQSRANDDPARLITSQTGLRWIRLRKTVSEFPNPLNEVRRYWKLCLPIAVVVAVGWSYRDIESGKVYAVVPSPAIVASAAATEEGGLGDLYEDAKVDQLKLLDFFLETVQDADDKQNQFAKRLLFLPTPRIELTEIRDRFNARPASKKSVEILADDLEVFWKKYERQSLPVQHHVVYNQEFAIALTDRFGRHLNDFVTQVASLQMAISSSELSVPLNHVEAACRSSRLAWFDLFLAHEGGQLHKLNWKLFAETQQNAARLTKELSARMEKEHDPEAARVAGYAKSNGFRWESTEALLFKGDPFAATEKMVATMER